MLEEDLCGCFDMEQGDLRKHAGRGEPARFQEGTISASSRRACARGSPQARAWRRIAALLWEALASRRRLRAPHLVPRELAALARLQAKLGKLAAQDLVGDIGLDEAQKVSRQKDLERQLRETGAMTYGQLRSLEGYARQAAKAFDLRGARGRTKAWRAWAQEAVRGGAGAARGFCRAPSGVDR